MFYICNMFKHVFRIVVLLLLGFLTRCNDKIEYSIIPEILMSDKQVFLNPTQMIINFTDGDGDIGLTQSDSATPPYNFVPDSSNPEMSSNIYYYNLILHYYEKRDSVWEFIDFKEPLIGDELPVPFHGQVPIITPSGQNKALKGEIQLDIDLGLSFTRTDSIRFEIILIDRELHESNRLVTPAIYK